ncbi:unnamed protein product [Cuscuta campestris]|uniref:Uncharacterized protein n=1 Tax=Cuscuta campestris TaxID=132261 RepID=A0A484K8V2_9ASTE|nr:unnamed protein product [Cuscuta campestris]
MLELRFRTMVKGNQSITEYCRLLKNLSEYLDDVDAFVTKQALVLQMLQGLPHDIWSQNDALHNTGLSSTALLRALTTAHSSTDLEAKTRAKKITGHRKGEFAMTNMGDFHFFLGINVQRTTQTQFLYDILERAVNPVKHQRTKYIKVDIHFVRDRVALGQIRVLHGEVRVVGFIWRFLSATYKEKHKISKWVEPT